jgi:hypothetical protein
MDPYLALIAGTPSESDKQEEIARRLRRQSNFATLGQITGDPVLSEWGKGTLKRSQESAEQMGKNRLKDESQRALKRYYEAMQQNMQGRLQLDRDKFNREAELAANPPPPEPMTPKEYSDQFQKLRTSDINNFEDMGQIFQIATELRGTLDIPEFDPGQASVFGMNIPGVRSLANYAAQYGIGTGDSFESADFWRLWDRFYTLPERNRLFGATLTPNEQKAWRGASISPEMNKEQITKNMDILLNIYQNAMSKAYRGYVAGGYNPDEIALRLGVDPSAFETTDSGIPGIPNSYGPQVLDDNDVQQPPPVQAPPAAQAPAAPPPPPPMPQGVTVRKKHTTGGGM